MINNILDSSGLPQYTFDFSQPEYIALPSAFPPKCKLVIVTPRWYMREVLDQPKHHEHRLQQLKEIFAAGHWEPPQHIQRLRKGSVLHAGANMRLTKIFVALQRANGRLDAGVLEMIAQQGLLGRILVMAFDREGALCYTYIGEALAQACSKEWRHDFISCPVDQTGQHDAVYSRWCARAYFAALKSGGSRDVIDVVINPIPGQKLAKRSQYERLLLPITLRNGTPGLLCVSDFVAAAFPLAAPPSNNRRRIRPDPE